MERFGKTIIIIGILVVVAGVIIWMFGDKLRWLGRLPGDIRIERENFRFYMPITTMIIVSIVLSAI
ncbi:MAG: DUF2905 domain-containing protein, partial [Taibaiella sp.]|nr:DUF2905 domain-containing protein [Taibaiella sp.]